MPTIPDETKPKVPAVPVQQPAADRHLYRGREYATSIARRYADALGLPSATYTAGNPSGRRIGPLGELLFP